MVYCEENVYPKDNSPYCSNLGANLAIFVPTPLSGAMEFRPDAAAFLVAMDAEWKAEGLLTRAERKALLARNIEREKGKGKGKDKVSAIATEAWLNEAEKGKGK